MKDAQQPRRARLILSDGFDNHSRISQTELINLALEADVQVYSMIFDTGIPGSGFVPFAPAMTLKPWEAARVRQQGPEILEKLSARTGGLYFHVIGDGSAKEAVIRTGRALRGGYYSRWKPGLHPAPVISG